MRPWSHFVARGRTALLLAFFGVSPARFTLGVHDGDSAYVEEAMILNPPGLECGIWLAPSTIPGAGLGMYAGRDFDVEETMLRNHENEPVGDLCVPLVDVSEHYGASADLLWDEYVWG
jgi:hypothetical protein